MKFEQHRFRVLDSWRGLAACFVALFHFRNVVNSHLYEFSFFHYSYLFVDFFFVLSGFVIFANYERKLREGYSFWKFMLLRFGRLYPLHLFLLFLILVFCALEALVPQIRQFITINPFSGANEMDYLPSQLLLLHGLGIDDRLSFNRPSWTISAEFYSYAFFAALIILFKSRTALALIFVALGAGMVLGIYDPHLIGTYNFGFLRCLYSFAIGALCWQIFNANEQRLASWAAKGRLWSALEIALFIVLMLLISYADNLFRLSYPFFFGLVILVFSQETGTVSRILSKKPFLILGALSYSIYMLQAFSVFAGMMVTRWMMQIWPAHQAVVDGRTVWGPSPWHGDLIVIPYLLLVVAGSVFTYYLVEMPGRNFFRKVAGRKPGDNAPEVRI